MVVTEGRFFQMPRHFRMAGVCAPVKLAQGLQRLEAALKSSVDMKKFHDTLYEKYRMVVTEGRFFQMPRHFRMAGVCAPGKLAQGLQRLEAALKGSTA
jgi:aspartate/methionine/tyrosine aminotransferase